MYICVYIWQRLNKSVPWTVSLEKAQTCYILKMFAGKKAPAAAIKNHKNVNNDFS